MAFLFDGEQFHLNDLLPTEQFCEKGYVALIKKELLEAPEGLNKFLNHCFKPFRFAQLDSDCKDLGKYLCDSKYKVGMTEVIQTPFLILHKDDRVL